MDLIEVGHFSTNKLQWIKMMLKQLPEKLGLESMSQIEKGKSTDNIREQIAYRERIDGIRKRMQSIQNS